MSTDDAAPPEASFPGTPSQGHRRRRYLSLVATIVVLVLLIAGLVFVSSDHVAAPPPGATWTRYTDASCRCSAEFPLQPRPSFGSEDLVQVHGLSSLAGTTPLGIIATWSLEDDGIGPDETSLNEYLQTYASSTAQTVLFTTSGRIGSDNYLEALLTGFNEYSRVRVFYANSTLYALVVGSTDRALFDRFVGTFQTYSV